MIKLSAIVIAKNSEQLIEDCLKSLSFCDEIILVDNGSNDETVNIAKRYKARIFRESSSDFSKLRNIGLSHAKSEWVLYIDSDERVDDLLRENIQAVIANPALRSEAIFDISAYRIKRKNFYLGNHQWPTIEKLERLFRRENLEKWYGQLHESPVVRGEIGELDGFLIHLSHRDLSSMLDKTISWSKVEAQLRLDAKHPTMTWWRFPRVMITAFLNSYIKQKGFKAGTAGLIESIYQSFSSFITYARVWELQKENSEKS